jgi:hypothetical protein
MMVSSVFLRRPRCRSNGGSELPATCAVIADPAIAARIAVTGQIVAPGTPAEFARSIEEQRAAFGAIAKPLNLRSTR